MCYHPLSAQPSYSRLKIGAFLTVDLQARGMVDPAARPAVLANLVQDLQAFCSMRWPMPGAHRLAAGG